MPAVHIFGSRLDDMPRKLYELNEALRQGAINLDKLPVKVNALKSLYNG